MAKIKHINPNCLGVNYCQPHGETGEVYYSSVNVKKLLIQERQKINANWKKKIKKIKKCKVSKSANWTRDDRVIKMINQVLQDLLTKRI